MSYSSSILKVLLRQYVFNQIILVSDYPEITPIFKVL